jgi:hypothetical protein
MLRVRESNLLRCTTEWAVLFADRIGAGFYWRVVFVEDQGASLILNIGGKSVQ